MKILLISTSVVPISPTMRYGGVEKVAYDFAEGLSKFHDVTIAAPEESIPPEGVQLLPTVAIPKEQDRDDLALYAIIDYTNNNGFTFHVVHDFSHGHVFSKYPNNKSAIYMIWDPIIQKYPKSPYNAICLSEWQRARFNSLYSQKALVMPMPINTQKYHPAQNPTRERFLFLGKISREKGVHLAIEYARKAHVGLDIVGGLIPSELKSDYLREIQALCDGKQICLYFNVAEQDKLDFLQNAIAVVYPVQQDEAHWLVGMEAWCCGVPTICFNRGAMSEVSLGVVANDEDEFIGYMKYPSFPSGYNHLLSEEATQTYGRAHVLKRYLDIYDWVSRGGRW